MSISKKTRFEIFKRDRFACQYCGSKPPDVVLECDHVKPKCEGGTDEYGNLITSCFSCNRGKGGRELGDSDCDRVQQMQLETIAQLAAFNEMLIAARDVHDAQIEWLSNRVASDLGWESLTAEEHASLRQFHRRLDLEDILEASEITGARHYSGAGPRWRYFCGICWNKIRVKEKAV